MYRKALKNKRKVWEWVRDQAINFRDTKNIIAYVSKII
jgi:hypothetical protein